MASPSGLTSRSISSFPYGKSSSTANNPGRILTSFRSARAACFITDRSSPTMRISISLPGGPPTALSNITNFSIPGINFVSARQALISSLFLTNLSSPDKSSTVNEPIWPPLTLFDIEPLPVSLTPIFPTAYLIKLPL